MSQTLTVSGQAAESGPSASLIVMIAIATGALVANLYYAQPLVASIAPAIGVGLDLAGSVVSVTQLGYGVGLLLLVSLADLVENKRLVLITLACTTLGLVGAALARSAQAFLAASFVVGVCSSGAQVLVPFVAHLTPEMRRGRVVGNVMAGLLTGIMLARPLALTIAAALGWRAVFWISAGVMVVIGLLLARLMPARRPQASLGYGQILGSLAGLYRHTPALRWRSTYQALMFAAFNIFWTAVPLLLAQGFGLSQYGIALFALAGAGGALAAPLAGRLADRGLAKLATGAAMAVLAVCFFSTRWAAAAGALLTLVVLTVFLDAAVQTTQVVSQRIIFTLPADRRGRFNALYMIITFMGGALGSLLGTATYHWGGWPSTASLGALLGLFLLLLFGLELLAQGRASLADPEP